MLTTPLASGCAGIATQTVLTIPMSHVNSGQLVNLALSSGQVVSTTVAHLNSIAGQPQGLPQGLPLNNGLREFLSWGPGTESLEHGV